ncbi:hypothetical protein I4U23_005643 [Adineta vaga]|nr:hypothetical protein I4U23_005643 [Adineta vaga]
MTSKGYEESEEDSERIKCVIGLIIGGTVILLLSVGVITAVGFVVSEYQKPTTEPGSIHKSIMRVDRYT